jgi:hypothetical protein
LSNTRGGSDRCQSVDVFVKITPKERKKDRVEIAVEFLPEESDTKYIFLVENAVEFTRD